MENNVLTPLQQRALVTLFANGLADRGYYLTGGTALSAFYLQHRYKEAALDEEYGILDFATNLLTVKELQFLPRMIKPLTLEELRAYFVPIAEDVIRRLRPLGE